MKTVGYIVAGVALALVAGVAGAQTATWNLSSSISRSQAVISTTCAATATAVQCPGDTKSQLHYLPSGASTVYLGLDPTVTASTGLPLAAGGKQAWDVAGGGLVRCITASGTQTMYTLCGRGP